MYQKQKKRWKEMKTTTHWSEQSGPSLVKKKKQNKTKMMKKHANKSHYNFDNLNVVNLKTKRKKIDQE